MHSKSQPNVSDIIKCKGSLVQSTDRQGSQSHVYTMAGATKSRRSKPEIKVKKNVQDQSIRHAMMRRNIVCDTDIGLQREDTEKPATQIRVN